MKNHYIVSSYFLGVILTTFVGVSHTLFASTPDTPPGYYTGGYIGHYFENITSTACPEGQAIVGFSTGSNESFSTPLCQTVSYWLKNGDSLYYNSGSVGIGTNNPQAVLDVSGDIMVNGISAGRGSGGIATNTVFGSGGLSSNVNGSYSTAIGFRSLKNNTTGTYNTAVGANTLTLNGTGNFNAAFGLQALYANTFGVGNTALGTHPLYRNTSGNYNTAVGLQALFTNSTGTYNTANGVNALYFNTIGNNNTANGGSALYYNTTGNYNTAHGAYSLYSNTLGVSNTAIGYASLYTNSRGSYNSAIGQQSLYVNSTGSYNTANGVYSLYYTTGNSNTALGYYAGHALTSGNYNILIGYNAQAPISATSSNQLNIGNWIYGNNGNIGIGTTNMTAALTVSGNIIANNPTASSHVATKSYVDAQVVAAGGELNVYKSDGTTLLGRYIGTESFADPTVTGCDAIIYLDSGDHLTRITPNVGGCKIVWPSSYIYYTTNNCTSTMYTQAYNIAQIENNGNIYSRGTMPSNTMTYGSRKHPTTGACEVGSYPGNGSQNYYWSQCFNNGGNYCYLADTQISLYQTRICGSGECQIK